jgi:hypothetical protein
MYIKITLQLAFKFSTAIKIRTQTLNIGKAIKQSVRKILPHFVTSQMQGQT